MKALTTCICILCHCFFSFAFKFTRLPFQSWKIGYGSNTNTLRKYELLRSNIRANLHQDRGGYAMDLFRETSKQDVILDDFDHILDAVYMYKKIFGDLKIPVKYEVPSSGPWPLHLHGLRLGKRLEKLLSAPEFFDEHQEKVEELEKMGFSPSLRSLVDDWDLIYDAMKVYKEIHGDLRIPSKFVVPDETKWPRLSRNLKLGVRVAAMRSAGRYVKDHPERKADLDALGFEWRIRDNTYKQQVVEELFDQVFECLKIYKSIHGDVNVPPNFVVPVEEPWPESLQGLNIGQHVTAIRNRDRLVHGFTDREEKLNALGFDWAPTTPRSQFSKKRFDVIYKALKVYSELKGDLLVPQAFVVPEHEPWPVESWNLKLGARVNSIRGQGTLVANFPERRALLDSIGFKWDLPPEGRRGKRKLKNDSVDFDDTKLKSEELLEGWNYKESDKQREKINGRSLPGRLVRQEEAVSSYEPSRMFEPLSFREVAAEAMREYMYAREFADDPRIRNTAHFEGGLSPEEFHKITIKSIPNIKIERMKSEGYRMLEFGRFTWDDVMSALRIYFEFYKHVNVPEEFTITHEEIIEQSGPNFHMSQVGLKLGEVVRGLRCGDFDGLEDESRKRELDKIAFDWGDLSSYQRYRFFPMLLGLQVYKHLYGIAMPHADFVVPDSPQWPYWMKDMPLGEWTANVRKQQKNLEENYPHRLDMLDSLGFIWWIPSS